MSDLRRIGVLLLLLPAIARADGGYRPPVPSTPIEPLPPGAWFRSGYQDFVLEHEPEAPRWAAVAGSFSSPRRAERAARSLDRTRLGLGYPWVVASHELRPAARCREEIVVVAGLFVRREDAEGWRAQDPARARLGLVELEHPEVAPGGCDWETEAGAAGRHLEITHVDPSGDAPGYAAAALESDEASPRERLASATPVCMVPRGSVHAFTGDRLPWRLGRGFAAARCGGRLVYVPVERTLRGTVFERRADGTRVHQITDVMCDGAHFDVWSYSFDGRTVIEAQAPTFSSPCAG